MKKAAALRDFGAPLILENLDDPIIGTGEVLVDVRSPDGRRPSTQCVSLPALRRVLAALRG